MWSACCSSRQGAAPWNRIGIIHINPTEARGRCDMKNIGFHKCCFRKKSSSLRNADFWESFYAIKFAGHKLRSKFWNKGFSFSLMREVLCTREIHFIKSLILLHMNGRLRVKEFHLYQNEITQIPNEVTIHNFLVKLTFLFISNCINPKCGTDAIDLIISWYSHIMSL